MSVNFLIFAAVTLDLKCLYLFLEKLHDENFVLAGRGIEIEFCFLCHALRVCAVTHHFFIIICFWREQSCQQTC